MLDCHFFIFLIIAPILSCSGLGTCCWRSLISEYTNSNSFWMPILFERSWCFAASKLTLSQEYSSWLLITSSFSSTLFNSELILSTSVLIRRLQFSKFFLKSAVCWMISLTSKLSPFCLSTCSRQLTLTIVTILIIALFNIIFNSYVNYFCQFFVGLSNICHTLLFFYKNKRGV